MLPEKLLHADYLDIVFDNRNKAYGGYELRRNYGRRMKKSGAIALLAVVILSSYSFIDLHRAPAKLVYHPTVPTILHHVEEHPPVVPPPPPVRQPEPPKPVKTIAHTEPDIEKDVLVRPEKQLTKNKDLKDVAISFKNQAGDATDLNPDVITKGKGTGSAVVTPPPPAKIPTFVEQMPQFSGDMNDYLSSHLKYPESARENNIHGRVTIEFVVNEDGTISNARVARKLGGGCDEEALRMVNAMPKWKPGKQNGIPVKVLLLLPIDFVLQ